MKFECDRCGLCCQHIDSVPQLKDFDSGNGRCVHLTNNNLCDIYLDRPVVCNVKKMYEIFFKSKLSEEEYLCLNTKGCKELKERYHSSSI